MNKKERAKQRNSERQRANEENRKEYFRKCAAPTILNGIKRLSDIKEGTLIVEETHYRYGKVSIVIEVSYGPTNNEVLVSYGNETEKKSLKPVEDPEPEGVWGSFIRDDYWH